jgi:hypothetical protein
MSKEAMKLALEALLAATPVKAKDPQMQAVAIVALQEALAQPQQEPVGTVYRYGKDSSGTPWHGIRWTASGLDLPDGTLIYTSPQPAQPQRGPMPTECRRDGRCQYAIDNGIEGLSLGFPQPAQRKPLTDEETKRFWHKARLCAGSNRWTVFKNLIETAHGIKGDA